MFSSSSSLSDAIYLLLYFSFVHGLSLPLKALFLFEDLSVVKYCVLTIVIRKTLNRLWVVGDVIRELFFDFGASLMLG